MIKYVLRYFLDLGPRALEMVQAPRYLNPALQQWCKPLGLGPDQINEKKSFKVRLFSCFVVGFILRGFLFTRIEIVISATKKYFLHGTLLFLL